MDTCAGETYTFLVSALAGENFALILLPSGSIREGPTGLAGRLDPFLVWAPPVNRTTKINPARPSNIWRREACCTAFAKDVFSDFQCHPYLAYIMMLTWFHPGMRMPD